MRSNFYRNFAVTHMTIDGTNYVLAAGTSDVNSEEISAANCLELSFLMTLGVMAASSTVDIKIQGSNTSGSGFVDIAGSALTQATATDDDEMLGITIYEPTYKYYRVATTRGDGGNSTINALHCFKSPRVTPVTQGTGTGQFVAAPEFSQGQTTGTA